MRVFHGLVVTGSTVLFLSACGSGNDSSPEATGGGGAIGPGSGGSGGVVSPDTGGAGGTGGSAGPGSGGVVSPDTGGAGGAGGSAGPGSGGVVSPGTGGAGGTGGSAGPGSGGTGGTAGAAGSRGCDQDVTGTWDLIASRDGGTSPGLLVIGRDTFELTLRNNDAPSSVLTYSGSGPTKAVEWTNSYFAPHRIAVQNTPGPMSLGAIPVSAGGSWLFTSNGGGRCAGTVSPGAIDVTCTTPSSRTVGGADWPNSIPRPESGTSYAANRSQARASWFGDLGGDWQTTPTKNGTCKATFQDNTVLLSCASTWHTGEVQLTVSADCVASGSTSDGYELSARRR